ncbi:Cobalt-precorrin-6A reductase [Listeria monocytogenes]|nr:Cobalt-precorrin-6A reductase [Listeria monocytogenes]
MIFVLGGTSDSLSVATDYGETLAKQHAENVFCGRLSKEEMLLKWHADATHPFATIVSETAMDAKKRTFLIFVLNALVNKQIILI